MLSGQLQPVDTYVDTTNQCNRFTQRTVGLFTRDIIMLNQETCSSLESKTRIGILVNIDINRVTRAWNRQSKYRLVD